jgi:hypothetical protein
MLTTYLVRIRDVEYHADSAETLRSWIEAGRVPRSAHVLEPGATQWRMAGELPYFRAFFGDHFHVCRVCGYEGTPSTSSKLNGCVAITLLLLLVVPGIIYLVWASSTASDQICPKCGGVNSMIPGSSPLAAQFLRPALPSAATADEVTFCSACGKYSPMKFVHCPHCAAEAPMAKPLQIE